MGEDFSYSPQDRYGLVMTSDSETRYYCSRALQPLLNELNVWDFSGTLSPCIWLTLSVLSLHTSCMIASLTRRLFTYSPSLIFYVWASSNEASSGVFFRHAGLRSLPVSIPLPKCMGIKGASRIYILGLISISVHDRRYTCS